MNICVVTFYGNNYGACLQAYATQQYLTQQGHHCDILRYENRFTRNKYNALFNKLKALVRFKKYMAERKLVHANWSKIQERNNCFEQFREKYLQLTDQEYVYGSGDTTIFDNYDVIICGSDQIWNPTLYDRCHPVYYLSVVPDDKKKISLSSSIGVSQLKEKYHEQFRTYLARFHAISVREYEGSQLVKEIARCNAQWTLDPTLLLTAQEWLKLPSRYIIKKNYVFCYMFNNFPYIQEIKQWIHDHLRLEIVSFPFVGREMGSLDTQIYDASPVDFVHIIKNSKFVLTDSFHATAFSINLNVPFFSIERQNPSFSGNMNSRIYSILKMTSLEDRIINASNYKTKLEKINIDYVIANRVINEKRNETKRFLQNAIEMKE